MLPGITPALMSAASPGNDQFTKLLLHFDATGTQTITDSSFARHGNASIGGVIAMNPATGILGSPSSAYNAQAGTIFFPNSSDWEFGAGDFTVDWWEYMTALSSGWSISRDATTSFCPFLFGQSGIYMTSNASAWDIASARGASSFIQNAWTHVMKELAINTSQAAPPGIGRFGSFAITVPVKAASAVQRLIHIFHS